MKQNLRESVQNINGKNGREIDVLIVEGKTKVYRFAEAYFMAGKIVYLYVEDER